MTRADDPRIGTDLGSYRIEAVIGRGGMGVVYRAEQLGLARKVALKILAPVLVDDEAFRQRFVRESQMAAAIDHPNILPIYEAGEVDGVYFLAMRFVDGADLETRLRSGPLEPAQAVRLLGQVASALDAAGEAGLVHRDVKPANILIASSRGIEKADHAYLSDFGLTKHRGSQTGLTQTGAFMGTLDYVAPEQVEGRPVDSRTDQYSLACVAFHCLTGVTPFPRDTDIAIAMAHLHDPPPSASAIRPELPADVDAVLAKAMAKRPDDRYPTSEAFALALREALGVRISEPHSIPSTATSDRRPLFIGLLAVVAVLAAVGIGLFALGSGQPAPSTSLIDRSPPASVAVSPSGGPKGDPFPTLLESSLILSLPEESAPECVRGDGALLPTRQGPSMKPRAHVVCTLLGGTWPDVVEGVLWPPTDFFNGDDVILAMAKSDGIAEGDCATQARAFGGWRGPVQTEVDGGSYLCRPAVDGGAAELIWTVESARAYYKATALDGDRIALYDWWLAYRDEISP